MEVKVKGAKIGAEVGFRCTRCGLWTIRAIRIPPVFVAMLGTKLQTFEEDTEVTGFYIGPCCGGDLGENASKEGVHVIGADLDVENEAGPVSTGDEAGAPDVFRDAGDGDRFDAP